LPTCHVTHLDITATIARKNNVTSKNQKVIAMNYDNYERCIVEAHSFVLEGWTTRKVCQPATLGREKLATLLDALKSGDCCWIKLTEEQLEKRIADNQAREAAGETIYKQRKRPRRSDLKSAAIVDDDDDEDSVDDDDASGEGSS
jgi:hypothetical protein